MSAIYQNIGVILFIIGLIIVWSAHLSKNGDWFIGYGFWEMMGVSAIVAFIAAIWPVTALFAIIVAISKLIAFGIDKVIDVVNGTQNV